jgi:endonuclease/exonuclease/phosphatase family metal-dependent hydrolase
MQEFGPSLNLVVYPARKANVVMLQKILNKISTRVYRHFLYGFKDKFNHAIFQIKYKIKNHDGYKVLGLNIQYGHGKDMEFDLGRTSFFFNSFPVDMIALQETIAFPGFSLSEELSKNSETLKHHAFHGFDIIDGVEYGCGVLSSYPILRVEHQDFIPWKGRLKRGALACLIEHPLGRIWFLSVEFQPDLTGKEQEQQAKELIAFVNILDDVDNVIICGDLNSLPWFRSITLLSEKFINLREFEGASSRNKGTYHWLGLEFRLDYIFTNLKSDFFFSRVIESEISDHKPVLGLISAKEKTQA